VVEQVEDGHHVFRAYWKNAFLTHSNLEAAYHKAGARFRTSSTCSPRDFV
jgi:hypothetical protein